MNKGRSKKKDLYDVDTTAMYLSMCEYLGEYVDMTFEEDLPDKVWAELILKAFELEGMPNMDYEKLNRSLGCYLSNGAESGIGDSPSYSIATPPFDVWIEEMDF